MKSGRLLRRWWWLAIPLGLGLAWLSGFLLDRAVSARLQELGNQLAGEGYTFSIEKVRSHFFAGSINLHGINLAYDTLKIKELEEGDVSEILNFSADEVELLQVSYWDLLTDGEVRFHLVKVDQPFIQYFFTPGFEEEEPIEDVVEKEDVAELPSLITVDSLVISNAQGSTTDISGTRPAFDIGGLDIIARDLILRSYRNGKLAYRIGGADVHAWQLSAELPPIYDLHVSDLHLGHPTGLAMVKGLKLVPRYTEQEYGAHVEQETDLFVIAVDSIELLGIDAGRFIADQVLHMERMNVLSPKAKVYRDKTIHDGKFNYKHLPVSGLRKIGISLRIDSVTVNNGMVEYFEKDSKSPEYGTVSFSDIDGLMTGLNNSTDADTTSHLVVDATARVYEEVPVEMNYRASMASSNDAFTLNAKMGSLPFSIFNRMTDDLLNIQATEGKIRSMEVNMKGNEGTATGTMDLVYSDLRIDLVPQAEEWHEGKLKNLFGNALVRTNNLPGQKNYRQGHFTVSRRKDRAVFNFIWQAVKVGSVDTMAPGLLRKQMRKVVSQPNKKKKR